MGHRDSTGDRFFLRWGDMRFHCAPVAGDPNVIALPGWDCPHAARQVSHLYVPRFVAWFSCWRNFGMKMGENWRSLGKYFHSSMGMARCWWPGWSGSCVALAERLRVSE